MTRSGAMRAGSRTGAKSPWAGLIRRSLCGYNKRRVHLCERLQAMSPVSSRCSMRYGRGWCTVRVCSGVCTVRWVRAKRALCVRACVCGAVRVRLSGTSVAFGDPGWD